MVCYELLFGLFVWLVVVVFILWLVIAAYCGFDYCIVRVVWVYFDCCLFKVVYYSVCGCRLFYLVVFVVVICVFGIA